MIASAAWVNGWQFMLLLIVVIPVGAAAGCSIAWVYLRFAKAKKKKSFRLPDRDPSIPMGPSTLRSVNGKSKEEKKREKLILKRYRIEMELCREHGFLWVCPVCNSELITGQRKCRRPRHAGVAVDRVLVTLSHRSRMLEGRLAMYRVLRDHFEEDNHREAPASNHTVDQLLQGHHHNFTPDDSLINAEELFERMKFAQPQEENPPSASISRLQLGLGLD
jgi:hypothetical protein